MASNKKPVVTAILTTLVLSFIPLAAAAPCRAQATPPPAEYLLGTNGVNSTGVPDSLATYQPMAPGPAVSVSAVGHADKTAADDAWHLSVSPYLWFPGVHGTVGARGRSVGVHASAGDLLSHFRFGLMGTVEARHKRFVLPVDVIWVRLRDNKALPFPNLMATTANIKGSEFILTPKIGFRLLDQEKIKINALVGLRYWHFGENLQFTPSRLNLNFSSSQDWVDPVVGGRIELASSPKVVISILGDVGGWGTGSQLEYQVAGLLGYRIAPDWTLQAGYRYLHVNYRSGASIVDLATSGAVLGVTVNLK
jgi:hypothetical protein